MAGLCEWPDSPGGRFKCGRPARTTASNRTWARPVCGIHRRSAAARGWTIAGTICPDGGACHHECELACFRVSFCGPLSGVYPRDEWPKNLDRVHVAMDPSVPKCPHGCGRLHWLDDQWFCPVCRDEWNDEVVNPERIEVSYLHGGIEPTPEQRAAVVDAVVAELTD